MSGMKVTVFRERLTDICNESELPDAEIAKGLGVSKQTLSAWKCGVRSPKGPTVETIARYFNISVEWLMGFDVPMRSTSNQHLIDSDNERAKQIMQALHENPRLGLLFDKSKNMNQKDLDAILGVVDAIVKERDKDD